jgi:hypothetical protein
VPHGDPVGSYALTIGFQENIGAEAACITAGGAAVAESITCAPIQLAPLATRPHAEGP